MSARSRVGEVVELCGARLALGQSTHGREVAPRRLRALALPDGLATAERVPATAERVVKKSGHSTDTRPKIRPWSLLMKNQSTPGMGF